MCKKPTLLAIHNPSLGGSESDFGVAKKIGLTAEDHLAIHGMPKSGKSAKEVLKAFGEEGPSDSVEILADESADGGAGDKVQPTLDRFG